MTRNTQLFTALAIGSAIACASPALAVPIEITNVTFGSNNDGLGGLTQSPAGSTETWTTQAESVRYVHGGQGVDSGTVNSSFLGESVLARSNGNAYNMTGTFTWVDGDPDRNSRFGMYLFGDSDVVPNEDELGAIGVIYNSDDGGVGSNNGPDDDFSIFIGIDETSITSVERVQTLVPIASDLQGTEITISTDFTFFDDGGTDSINIETTLIAGGESTTTSAVVAAADYTGNYFGFVNRARDGGGNEPWTIDYETFTITQTAVPEPSSLALLGLGGLLAFRRRRSA